IIVRTITRVRYRRSLLPKRRSRIPPGGYFPNAPVYSGQTEEERTFRSGHFPPVLTDAILCRDRHKCFSRKTQVSDKAGINT
ncbi:hypothetical protein ACMYZ8_10085, partial [Bacteroides sp. KG156]|uniref:hypothetical protein n=1 Tax=Bacteroides sp. KG156 TaxID=3397828 RepID=UPI003D9554DD